MNYTEAKAKFTGRFLEPTGGIIVKCPLHGNLDTKTTIKNFASHQHRLRLKKLDGETIIPCRGKSPSRRDSSDIYQHSDALLGAMFLGAPRSRGNARRACIRAGCRKWQDGDAEGSLLFDPGQPEQVKAILEWYQPRKKRKLSPERRAVLVAAGEKTRKRKGDDQDRPGLALKGGLSAQDEPESVRGPGSRPDRVGTVRGA